jgi:quercetin dioxygenase-like cupin family protein
MEMFHRPPTAKGPAATFTGDVWVDGLYAGPSPEQARLSIVRFAPCARSHWHSHRLGQVLHILDGTALLGSRDDTVIEAHPGDTIYTAPGEEHWHGAAPGHFMAHLALMEGDGSGEPQTVWGEAVSDSDYQAPRTPTR